MLTPSQFQYDPVTLRSQKAFLHSYHIYNINKQFSDSYNKSRDKKIIVEPYIIGKQQSFTAFVIDRKVKVYTSNNCLSIVNPYLIQAETLPAEGIDQIKGQLISIIESIVEDLDLKDGILCLQYIVRDGQPYIIEMMRRCFGNQFLTLSEMFTVSRGKDTKMTAIFQFRLTDRNIRNTFS